MIEIEVIAKSSDKIFKIINLTEDDFKKMKRKEGFTYQAFQPGFSAYKTAITINFNK